MHTTWTSLTESVLYYISIREISDSCCSALAAGALAARGGRGRRGGGRVVHAALGGRGRPLQLALRRELQLQRVRVQPLGQQERLQCRHFLTVQRDARPAVHGCRQLLSHTHFRIVRVIIPFFIFIAASFNIFRSWFFLRFLFFFKFIRIRAAYDVNLCSDFGVEFRYSANEGLCPSNMKNGSLTAFFPLTNTIIESEIQNDLTMIVWAILPYYMLFYWNILMFNNNNYTNLNKEAKHSGSFKIDLAEWPELSTFINWGISSFAISENSLYISSSSRE